MSFNKNKYLLIEASSDARSGEVGVGQPGGVVGCEVPPLVEAGGLAAGEGEAGQLGAQRQAEGGPGRVLQPIRGEHCAVLTNHSSPAAASWRGRSSRPCPRRTRSPPPCARPRPPPPRGPGTGSLARSCRQSCSQQFGYQRSLEPPVSYVIIFVDKCPNFRWCHHV